MHALLIVDTGFQDEEFVYPYYRMLEEGWRVDVGTPDGEDRKGKYGVPARATAKIAAALANLPDVLVIPGGFESPDRLRMIPEVKALVVRMDQQRRVIAAICHGPWVLISAGICKDRFMVGYDSITPDLWNAGAKVDDTRRVVHDLNIITAKHYKDNGPFMRAVIEASARRAWSGDGCNV